MATLTVTPTQTFVSGNTVTPATLNQLAQSTVALTAGSIVAADIASDAVTNVKIASGVDASKLTTGTLPIARIADAAVTAPKLQNGVTLQTVYAQTATAQYIDTVTPTDNTKPQNTEGEEVITASITPSSNTNKVLVETMLNGTQETGGSGTIVVALFKGSDASAIATAHHTFNAGYGGQLHLVFQDSPATEAPVTYKIRVGYSAGGGGFFINQFSSGAAYDGTMISCLKLTEIKA